MLQTIMPGFTHLKNAQPISFAHYLLAYTLKYLKEIEKDLYNNILNLDECPLGVAALAGTSYKIDRVFVQQKNWVLRSLLLIQLIPFPIEILF